MLSSQLSGREAGRAATGWSVLWLLSPWQLDASCALTVPAVTNANATANTANTASTATSTSPGSSAARVPGGKQHGFPWINYERWSGADCCECI